ncbi:hypothetical protein BKA93DRAFT_520570 [Sparassis latifolia]
MSIQKHVQCIYTLGTRGVSILFLSGAGGVTGVDSGSPPSGLPMVPTPKPLLLSHRHCAGVVNIRLSQYLGTSPLFAAHTLACLMSPVVVIRTSQRREPVLLLTTETHGCRKVFPRISEPLPVIYRNIGIPRVTNRAVGPQRYQSGTKCVVAEFAEGK